jgi:hypothetical protein
MILITRDIYISFINKLIIDVFYTYMVHYEQKYVYYNGTH